MSNEKPKSIEERQSGLAPETHNSEQDDHLSQAQSVTQDAKAYQKDRASPVDSAKSAADVPLGAEEPDTLDAIKNMTDTGEIDMGAYAGEPNHDDNTDKYSGSELDRS